MPRAETREVVLEVERGTPVLCPGVGIVETTWQSPDGTEAVLVRLLGHSPEHAYLEVRGLRLRVTDDEPVARGEVLGHAAGGSVAGVGTRISWTGGAVDIGLRPLLGTIGASIGGMLAVALLPGKHGRRRRQ